MPAKAPTIADAAAEKLVALGEQIRAHRKALRVNATAAAEAAGVSRVTVHRIENGEPGVAIGAYLNAMTALGLDFGIAAPALTAREPMPGWIPARVRLADYPQLKQLAWQVHGVDTLTPEEALSIYERNARHIDATAIEPHEQQLIDALRVALRGPASRV